MTIAALNDFKVLACDIQNAYLTVNCREKVWIRAGPEFGSDAGKRMLIVRALYGLKSSGAAFRSLLAETLHYLGIKPTKTDPDVWPRPAVKPDGFEYYKLVLCYVVDVLCMSDDAMRTMKGIQRSFKLKDDKIEEPKTYLGARLLKMTTANGTECWSISSESYCKASVTYVEKKLCDEGRRFPSKCDTLMQSVYLPELDKSPELKADGVQYYQELIGVLHWSVELGRVENLYEVATMSTDLAMPRIGHLQELLHMFGYPKANMKGKLAFDPYPL